MKYKSKPSFKEKLRYVLFDLHYTTKTKLIKFLNFNKEELIKKIVENYIFYYGILDYNESSLSFMKEKFLKNYGIAIIKSDRIEKLKASFVLFNKKLGNKILIIKTIKTFGTLKKLKLFLGE